MNILVEAAYCSSPISSMGTSVSLVLLARNIAKCEKTDYGTAFEEYENVLEDVCRKGAEVAAGDRESAISAGKRVICVGCQGVSELEWIDKLDRDVAGGQEFGVKV